MSQNDELERIKTRIKALTERTVARGCTEAEAMAAAEMVGRLLERYALSMDELDVRQEPCVQIEIPLGGRRRRPIDLCIRALARFCDCKVWLARSKQQAHYVFFGFDTDTRLAGYLFALIARAISSELAAFRASKAVLTGVVLRQASASFQHGMALRVAERLESMHSEREAAVSAQRSTGTALILIRHQVVEDAFRVRDMKLQASPKLTLRRNAAFQEGRNAGERVNLRRPVEGAGATQSLA